MPRTPPQGSEASDPLRDFGQDARSQCLLRFQKAGAQLGGATVSVAETKMATTPGPEPAPGFGWLVAAPHRLFFFLASLLLLIASTWWALVLPLRLVGLSMPG